MRKTLLSALGVAIVLSGGVIADRAEAMTLATPVGSASLVVEAAIICGGMGCAPVQTKQIQRRKFQPLGYTKPLPQSTPAPSTLPPKL
jgi:hypothetical protein